MSYFSYYYISINFIYTYIIKSQIIDIIKEFLNIINNRYNKSIRYFYINGERSLKRKFDDYITTLNIIIKRSLLITPA
jgi:hypothetical protein